MKDDMVPVGPVSDSSLTQVDKRDDREWTLTGMIFSGPPSDRSARIPTIEPRLGRDEVVVVVPKSRLVEVERERDEAKGINEFDIGVANAELAEDLKAAEARAEGYREALEKARKWGDEMQSEASRLADSVAPALNTGRAQLGYGAGMSVAAVQRLVEQWTALRLAALRPSSGENPRQEDSVIRASGEST